MNPNSERLEAVYRRGAQIRRRRIIVRTGSGFATALALFVAATVVFQSNPNPTSFIRPASSTEASPSVTAEPSAAPTTEPDGSPPTAPTPTSELGEDPTDPPEPVLVCRNSPDPDCGPFYWDPEPAPNQPLTLSISMSPTDPEVGETVVFTVVASDPDARVATRATRLRYGDGSGETSSGSWAACKPTYGPWTPPEPVRDSSTETYEASYDEPGETTFEVTYKSWNALKECYKHDPYGSEATERLTFTVADGEAP